MMIYSIILNIILAGVLFGMIHEYSEIKKEKKILKQEASSLRQQAANLSKQVQDDYYFKRYKHVQQDFLESEYQKNNLKKENNLRGQRINELLEFISKREDLIVKLTKRVD
jgi:hypothetical protein